MPLILGPGLHFKPVMEGGPPVYSFKVPTPFLEAMYEGKLETPAELGFDLIVVDLCAASRAKKMFGLKGSDER